MAPKRKGSTAAGGPVPKKQRNAAASVKLETKLPPLAAEDTANASLYGKVQVNLDRIMEHPVMRELGQSSPADIGADAGSSYIAPYSDENFTSAMHSRGTYVCGCNMMWFQILFNPQPKVPLRESSVETLLLKEFGADEPPPKFPGLVQVAADPDLTVLPSTMFGSWKRISPEEPMFAVIMKVGRGIQSGWDDSVVEKWKNFFLSIAVEFQKCGKEDITWKSMSARETIGTQYETLYPTAPGRVYQIGVFKDEMASGGRVVSQQDIFNEFNNNVEFAAEFKKKFTMTYIEVCCNIWDNLFSVPGFRKVVLGHE